MFSRSTTIFRRSKTIADELRNRIFTRSMGGGPRTFPGGLNKWQWKRLHEKKAKEKERKLLDQEKQLYQARIRSQLRAAIAGKPESDGDSKKHKPISPREHIRALADRFIKDGAEDLWNQDDGPLKSEEEPQLVGSRNRRPGSILSPVDVKKLRSHNACSQENLNFRNSNYVSKRNYSVQSRARFRRYESSSSSDDERKSGLRGRALVGDREVVGSADVWKFIKGRSFTKHKRFKGDDSSSEDDDSDFDTEDEVRQSHDIRKLGSSASLGKYDLKIRKRVPLKQLEEEVDFSEQVELLRKELNRKLLQDEERKGEEESHYSQKRFSECGISSLTVKALSFAGYIQMTRIQEATISACLVGKDVLVKAKAGAGKSAAFLLPAIETVLKTFSTNATQRVPPVDVLILCPTRELASQLAAEANALLKYHVGIGVLTLVGGTRFKVDQKRLESDPCQIIVATPGRLLDHVEDKSGLSVRLMGLKMLILDEADHLLDLGFRKDIEKIVDCLPRQRQSLMFSTTIPKEVRRISQLILKRDHAYIDSVGLGSVETHAKVKQSCLIAPQELHFAAVHQLLKQHVSHAPDYKVIVFCATAMITSLMYLLLREMKMNVREMHSRKPQLYRTRISDEFKQAKRIILVTSDVSARGMNYPDVTLVIQVGIPSGREEYIHRLGRTGREGKDGEGILLLAPFEEYFLREIEDLPLEKLACLDLDPEAKLQLDNSMNKIDGSVKEAAYHAWLGYYNSIREIGRDKTALAELANRFSESLGLQKPPPLFRRTALKMGLKDIPGIRIRK